MKSNFPLIGNIGSQWQDNIFLHNDSTHIVTWYYIDLNISAKEKKLCLQSALGVNKNGGSSKTKD